MSLLWINETKLLKHISISPGNQSSRSLENRHKKTDQKSAVTHCCKCQMHFIVFSCIVENKVAVNDRFGFQIVSIYFSLMNYRKSRFSKLQNLPFSFSFTVSEMCLHHAVASSELYFLPESSSFKTSWMIAFTEAGRNLITA